MKFIIRFSLLLVSVSCIFFQTGYGQDKTNLTTKEAFTLIEQVYGSDPVLINGKYFEDVYRNDLGHPYYKDDAYVPGYMVIRDKRIDTLRLKYNIYNQTLVICPYSGLNASPAFIPPNEFIEEFSVYGEDFKRYIFENGRSGFYHELYSGKELSCIYGYSKRKDESYHNKTYLAYRFAKTQKKYYILRHGSIVQFRSNRSFIHAFNREFQKEILIFLRANEINLKRGDDQKVEKLGAYCDKLLMETNKN